MTIGTIHSIRRAILVLGLLLGNLTILPCFAVDNHNPEDFRAENDEDKKKPREFACNKAADELRKSPTLDKKARIIWALRQFMKDAHATNSSVFAPPDLEILENCLKIDGFPKELADQVYILIEADTEADNPIGIKSLMDLIHVKSEDPKISTKRSAAFHLLNLRLAYSENKPWIDAILKMHEEAISPFKALHLLTKHRAQTALDAALPALAESLAREKISLSIDGRKKVAAILATLAPKNSNDQKLLAYMKFIYGGETAGVSADVQGELKKAEERAGVLAEQWNENLEKVVRADGTIDLTAKLTVSSFDKPDRTDVSGAAWLEEQEKTYGRNALIQWAIARGGEPGGRTIIAALKGSSPKATELVVRLPSSSPTLKVGTTDIHGNDRIQLANLNNPVTLAAEAKKILPTSDPAAWDKLRFDPAEAPTKDGAEPAVLKISDDKVIRIEAKAAPPPPVSAKLNFDELVAETEWSQTIPTLTNPVKNPAENHVDKEGGNVFLAKPKGTKPFEIKAPPLLEAVLTDLSSEHAIPLGPNPEDPAIVGFDKTQKILIVRERYADDEDDYFYTIPFDHYKQLTDTKPVLSFASRLAAIRKAVPKNADHPWDEIKSTGGAKIESKGEAPNKRILVLVPKARIVDRAMPLAKLKSTLETDKTRVQWSPGSGYIFGFNDEKKILYLTFDGFPASSERRVFSITYAEYEDLIKGGG